MFRTLIIAEKHKAHFFRAIAIMAVWTVLSRCLTINLRVIELDDFFILFASSLQAYP